MGTEYNLVSTDAQRSLEIFSEEFTLALTQSAVDPWARANGLYKTAPKLALKMTFPVPVSAAGYAEFKGDVKYRSLFEKSMELKPKTWQDGVSELASTVEAPDFIGWNEQPAAMAAAASSLANEIVAGLLETNGECWDGKNFFASDHPLNVFDEGAGDFDNDITGAGTDLTQANLETAMTNFRKIKGPNGKPLGLRLTHLLVPPALEGVARKLLTDDFIISAIGDAFGPVPNPYKSMGIKLIVSDELTDDDKWYALALNKPGMYPWIVMEETAPEPIVSDKTDPLYKTTLKVGIAYILRGNGGLALPHCAQRWAGEAAA